MTKRKPNPNFVNGVPELLILQLLSSAEMYGYEIVKEIRSVSKETLSFGEGCIYPLLHSLEADGFLVSRTAKTNGRNRYYYKTTKSGHKKLEKITDEWERTKVGVDAILGGMNVRPAAV